MVQSAHGQLRAPKIPYPRNKPSRPFSIGTVFVLKMLGHHFFLVDDEPVPDWMLQHDPCQEGPGVEIKGDTQGYERDPGGIQWMTKPPERTGRA
jgi:hypothetical protein